MLLTMTALARGNDLPKGFRLLIEHGFQIQGMATKDDVFHPETYRGAGYTAINWLGESDVSKHGAAPGMAWSRWAHDKEHMPPVGGEGPYMSRLVSVSLWDEPDLNSEKIRQQNIDWYAQVRDRYPNVILYTNNWGLQINDAAYDDFLTRAKPDMISFDTYPWKSDYETKKPLAYEGNAGNPLMFYKALKFTRAYARAHHIPFQIYRQAFHAEEEWSKTIYRDPSPSEFRLNTFAAMAFGAKSIVDFTYNTGATSFFKRPGGDTNKLPLYGDLVMVNRRARNLGKALVRLKPIDESKMTDGKATTDSRVTGILFIRGQHMEDGKPAFNALPTDFHVDAQSHDAYSDWEMGRNDPYLSGFAVTRVKSDGLKGDVIIAWFKVLDETFDGTEAKDEIYMMVVNGLTAIDGTAADCAQKIQLDFGSSKTPFPYETMQRLNPDTAQIEAIALEKVGGKRRLVMTLEGGAGELLKFPTGAPFVGVQK